MDSAPSTAQVNPSVAQTSLDRPVPLSFPAILSEGRNLRFEASQGDRSHLPGSIVAKKRILAGTREGKRWIRRKENAQFVSNPHVVTPSSQDMTLSQPSARQTFPVPLPPYILRTAPVPGSATPVHDKSSSSLGQFTMSMKGVRKALKKSGPRAQALVQTIEREILNWLGDADVTIIKPSKEPIPQTTPSRRIGDGSIASIYEIQRSFTELVWSVDDDAFARYLVHCVSRYHGIVSFSKESPDGSRRFTHILRPTSRPAMDGSFSWNTPPVTDLDSASDFLASDIPSDLSDSELVPLNGEDDDDIVLVEAQPQSPEARGPTTPSANRTATSSRTPLPTHQRVSSIGQYSTDNDEDDELVMIDRLTLQEQTPRAAVPRRPAERLYTMRTTALRSGSSPSRSPSRRFRSPQRCPPLLTQSGQSLPVPPTRVTRPAGTKAATFWEYVFA